MKIFGIEQSDTLIPPLNKPYKIFYKGENPIREGFPFFVPSIDNRFIAIPSIAIKMIKSGKCVHKDYAYKYYAEWAPAFDITALNILNQTKSQHLPWDMAKAFDNAVSIGNWNPIDTIESNTLLYEHNNQQLKLALDNIIAKCNDSIELMSFLRTIRLGDIILLNLISPDEFSSLQPIIENETITLYSTNNSKCELRVK